jgi:hypothetical protein
MVLGVVATLALLRCASSPVTPIDDAMLDAAVRGAADEVLALALSAPDLAPPGAAPFTPFAPLAQTARPRESRAGSDTTAEHTDEGPVFGAAGGAATPQGRTFGIGLQLGFPTALTLKYMLRPDQGISGGIGGMSGFVYNVGAFSLHAEYVYHPMVLAASDQYTVTWYVGGGANILVFGNPRQQTLLPRLTYYYFPTSVWLAARVPLGLNLAFSQQPFEIFLEAAPSLLLFPGLSFGLGGSIGARFYL